MYSPVQICTAVVVRMTQQPRQPSLLPSPPTPDLTDVCHRLDPRGPGPSPSPGTGPSTGTGTSTSTSTSIGTGIGTDQGRAGARSGTKGYGVTKRSCGQLAEWRCEQLRALDWPVGHVKLKLDREDLVLAMEKIIADFNAKQRGNPTIDQCFLKVAKIYLMMISPRSISIWQA
jgi:hypothetical protein